MTDTKDDGGPVDGTLLLLATGEIATVSEADIEVVNLYAWRLGLNGYVYRVGGRKRGEVCLLHRFVMNVCNGEEIHHINGNRLDNRRENLEITTRSEHQRQHHSHITSARNRSNRIYPLSRHCLGCGKLFRVHPDHRGRNRYCSRDCGNRNRRKVCNVS
ncbi:hypothetical protein LCGC14_0297780 [marine sediment metagenome]|uniref:HNH nuclease domain-containing protein n=1 Tax=marine sediment metagenome TaxID=412755 RepID=A0A0F9TW35_9ZZZZ